MVPSFAFDFNLRRYIQASLADFALTVDGLTVGSEVTGVLTFHCGASTVVGRCSLTLSKSVLKAPMISALQTRKLLSFLAFNFTLRRYTVVGSIAAALGHATVYSGGETFTVQLAELDAELVWVPARGGATAAATAAGAAAVAAVAAASSAGCAADRVDMKCGEDGDSGGAVCPRGMTCRAAACAPTAHDAGGTLASLLGDAAFSENFGGACVTPRCSASQCGQGGVNNVFHVIFHN